MLSAKGLKVENNRRVPKNGTLFLFPVSSAVFLLSSVLQFFFNLFLNLFSFVSNHHLQVFTHVLDEERESDPHSFDFLLYIRVYMTCLL